MLSDVLQARIQEYSPAGSNYVTPYLTFPIATPITTQTLASGFATKSHALLCRRYINGRDWYDFAWYAARRTVPDLKLLRNALFQQGPWQGKRIDISKDWFLKALGARVESVDWALAIEDVRRFISLKEQQSLEYWGTDFFLHHVERMAEYWPPHAI